MLSEYKYPCGIRRLSSLFAAILVLPMVFGTALAQDDEEDDEQIEEIVTVGSQIKGANIRDALAVSVVTSQDIEDLGVDSGDDLLECKNFGVTSLNEVREKLTRIRPETLAQAKSIPGVTPAAILSRSATKIPASTRAPSPGS